MSYIYDKRRDILYTFFDIRRVNRSTQSNSRSVFGMRLKAARVKTGLPQDQLGVLAGLEESSSSARMSRYETGTHLPDEQFAKRLADVLDVPMAYLYCDDDLIAELLLRIGALPVSKRRELLRYLDQR